jgi:hypothetical protein
MKTVIKRIFILLIIFNGFRGFSQDLGYDYLIRQIKFKVSFSCYEYSTEKKLSTQLKLFVNGSLYKSFNCNDKESCLIDVPLGKIYTITFNCEGYAKKKIELNLKDNLDKDIISGTKQYDFRGIRVYLVNTKNLPENIKNLLSSEDEFAKVYFNKLENLFNWDLSYSENVKTELEKIKNLANILDQNPSIREGFSSLNDTIMHQEEIINLKITELELNRRMQIIQQQKVRELALIQQIEREQFLTQKKLNEAEINEQKIIAQAKQKELELANQERKTKELEIKNATYTKNAFLGLAVFIAIVSLLLLRAYFIKRNSNTKLHKQNNLIAEQKQEITDSIQYAQRIQFAILPTKENIAKAFQQSFILFKPKDIVSGDFYWFQEVDGKKYIAACDCTGHGVPGALMSMVATDMLNEALVHTKKVDEILAHTNRSIRVALKQSTDDDSTRDGMDIALCCFNDKTNMLQYSRSLSSTLAHPSC